MMGGENVPTEMRLLDNLQGNVIFDTGFSHFQLVFKPSHCNLEQERV